MRQFLVIVSFIGYCFGEIMCTWDSYVYQKGVVVVVVLLLIIIITTTTTTTTTTTMTN
jgi:hypothetical protein